MSRHLLRVHKDNDRVAEILQMEKGSRQRYNALSLLANEGDLLHNVAVWKNGGGKLVVGKRDQNMRRTSDYIPCADCHKFVMRNMLQNHLKACVKRNASPSGVQTCLEVPVHSHDDSSSTLSTVELSSTTSDTNETLDNVLLQTLAESNVSGMVQDNRKARCKKPYDKKHFCLFCKKEVQNQIFRHLLTVHKNNERVEKILKMPKGSRERRIAQSLLVCEGTFQQSFDVLRNGVGTTDVQLCSAVPVYTCEQTSSTVNTVDFSDILSDAGETMASIMSQNANCSTVS